MPYPRLVEYLRVHTLWNLGHDDNDINNTFWRAMKRLLRCLIGRGFTDHHQFLTSSKISTLNLH